MITQIKIYYKNDCKILGFSLLIILFLKLDSFNTKFFITKI